MRIDEQTNEATISDLTFIDKIRLRNQKLGITRIMFQPGTSLHNALKQNEYKHSPFKYINGACTTSFVVCDLLDRAEATMAALKYTKDFRILKPNEGYYQQYDNSKEERIPVDYGHPSTPYEYS